MNNGSIINCARRPYTTMRLFPLHISVHLNSISWTIDIQEWYMFMTQQPRESCINLIWVTHRSHDISCAKVSLLIPHFLRQIYHAVIYSLWKLLIWRTSTDYERRGEWREWVILIVISPSGESNEQFLTFIRAVKSRWTLKFRTKCI